MTPDLPVAGGASGDTRSVPGTLRELLAPKGYVQWEYWSRLQSLAMNVVGNGPSRILDLGCGYGALSVALAAGVDIEVIGVDVLRDRVSSIMDRWRTRVSGRAGNLRLLVADADSDLPFRTGTFDVVVATEILEHLEDPEHTLREVHRVLREGGRLFMTTPNSEALPYQLLKILPPSAVRRLAKLLTQETLHPELMSCSPTHPDHHRREGFTLAELRTLSRRCSLELVRGHTYRIPLPDRLFAWAPSGLARRLASWGSRPVPRGLEVFAEFARAEDVA